MKRMLSCSLMLLLTLAACAAPAVQTAVIPDPINPTTDPGNEAAADQAVLLFTIGMHIEPLGVTAQGYPSGNGDYNRGQLFERHVEDLRTLAAIAEAHGGRMTIQAQSPFTTAAIATGDPILSDLAASGHEIALHFHEDAHMGKNSGDLSTQAWCDVMKQEMVLITQASGVTELRYWSGGNLYPGVFEAAACAGLDVNSDWKNPLLQETPLALTGIHPWRPSGGTDGSDFSLLLQDDPDGEVIFLPNGIYDRTNFGSMRRTGTAGGEEAYFEFLEQSLLASLAAAEAGKVNVFHFTIHPGEFRGDPEQPFGVIDRFLSEVVDPLAAEGRVQWATFAEMADAYAASPADQSAAERAEPAGTISFIINVHDWVHPDESAATLLMLVDLFERYGVRGDFYFTPEITGVLARQHPEVIERFKASDMTISYHVRPPHPLYAGFDARLQGLSDEALTQTLLDYETYAIDLATGELDRSQPGGYTYVAQVFGRNPVVAPAPSSNARIKDAAQRLYASLGAGMTLLYHEEGTRLEQPFEYVNGLLVRPSDFSVTRTTLIDGSENFWWNFMTRPDAELYNPTTLLQTQLAEWESHGERRAPFITVLIHENNFQRAGAEGWSSIYYSMDGGQKAGPLEPPWNLEAPDPSRLRNPEDQQAIISAYEELVAYAAANLQVVTSEDILAMAP